MILYLIPLTLLWVAFGLGFLILWRRLNHLEDALARLERSLIVPNTGGRIVPTAVELAAARNRIDSSGLARPGAP